jgi:DNA repair protein RecO
VSTKGALYRDEAIVLRTQKLGEADRIITMLTKEHGRIRGVAKGVRRTMSKFGARLEPGSHVDIQLHTGRTFDTITQVEALMNYGEEISAIINAGRLLMRFLKLQSASHHMKKSQLHKSSR